MHNLNLLTSTQTQPNFLSKEHIGLAFNVSVLILTIGIFIFDLISPLGIAAGAAYVLVVFSSVWMRGNMGTYITAAMGLIFTVLGFFLSSAIVSSMEAVIINRILSALLIIATAIMVLKIKKADAELTSLMVQSVIDPLTTLRNWRAFEQELESEITRNRRYNRSLSIAIFDIDHLKAINVTNGYDRGNQMIKQVAKEIENNIRKCDVLFRLEEGKFAILFAETGIQEAKRVAEVICKKIASGVEVNGNEVTVSSGIAALDDDDDKITLCQRMEEALLQSKRDGRNKVTTLPPVNIRNISCVPAILARSRV